MARPGQTKVSWKNVRSTLKNAEQRELLKILADLYSLRQENRDFLHARFINDGNALLPYKETIEQNISPPKPWQRGIKLSLARKAISDYRKAVGDPEGLAELMLHYAECGIGFTLEYGDIDEAYYASIVGVFYDGIKMLSQCGPDTIVKLLPRFVELVRSAADIGWEVQENLIDSLEFYYPDAWWERNHS